MPSFEQPSKRKPQRIAAWHGRSMTKPPASDDYERLVESLVTPLALDTGVQSERIVRDVRVQGQSTTNQIDVLWDFVDAQGQPQRVVFEARSYGKRVDQGKLHAFRSVVDDIQDAARPVTGVMVTTVGYQRGAKAIVSTYGLIVLELRAPDKTDFADRVTKVVLNIRVQTAIVDDVRFEATEVAEDNFPAGLEALDAFEIAAAVDDPNPKSLNDLLCHGELGSLDTPRPVHPVRRDFDPPAVLFVRGRKAALIQAVTAEVGDVKAAPATTTIGGPETIAWMLRDSLRGSRAWISDDGQIWKTQS